MAKFLSSWNYAANKLMDAGGDVMVLSWFCFMLVMCSGFVVLPYELSGGDGAAARHAAEWGLRIGCFGFKLGVLLFVGGFLASFVPLIANYAVTGKFVE